MDSYVTLTANIVIKATFYTHWIKRLPVTAMNEVFQAFSGFFVDEFYRNA